MSTTFCPLPFTHLNFKSKKRVSSCCMDSEQYTTDDSALLEQIWNSSSINELRDDLLNGKKPKRCSKCWDFESNSSASLRERENNILGDYKKESIINIYKTKGIVPIENLDFLEIRFDNICNLMCRMCGSHSSHLWGNEVKKSTILLNEMEKYGSASSSDLNYLSSSFPISRLNEIIKLSPNIRRIDISGGEPLISPLHYDFIERLIPESNHIYLNYATNLNILTYKNKDITKLWDNFKLINLNISIDGHNNDLYSYIRISGNLSDVEKNIQILKKYKNIKMRAKCTFSMLNILKILEISEYFKQLEIPFRSAIVQFPLPLNIKILPRELKNSIIKKWNNYVEKNQNDNDLIFWGNHVINYMNSEDLYESDWDKFEKYTNTMDNHFKTDIKKINPEFIPYM
jgi:MoaA/NifB/PqqE/SkfB family radical SAM enzyme